MIGRILFLIFFVAALLEVGAFILVGGAIGLWPTLLLVLLTAIVGAALLKRQGLATYQSARMKLDAGEAPLSELADGVALFAAALLLITPGFLTDVIGFSLFIPAVRRYLGRSILNAMPRGRTETKFYYYENGQRRPAGPDIIEGEATVISEEPQNDNGHTAPRPKGGSEERP